MRRTCKVRISEHIIISGRSEPDRSLQSVVNQHLSGALVSLIIIADDAHLTGVVRNMPSALQMLFSSGPADRSILCYSNPPGIPGYYDAVNGNRTRSTAISQQS